MVSIPKQVMNVLTGPRDPNSYRALITNSAGCIPNIAPMGSISTIDDETIVFCDMSTTTTKTRTNLEGPNKKVVIALFKPPILAFQVKGTFQGFQTSGQLYEKISKGVIEAAAKAGRPGLTVRAIGTVKVEEVYMSMPAKKLA